MPNSTMNGARSTMTRVAPPAPPAASRPRDPYIGLYFWVEIDGIEVAGFSECSPPTVETEVFEYSEGGENTFTHKFPVRTKYGNLTLKRGIDAGRDLYFWYEKSIGGRDKRRNMSINVYNSERKLLKKYDIRNAFPVKWTGPDLKSDAGAVTVETLEFSHEGFVVRNV